MRSTLLATAPLSLRDDLTDMLGSVAPVLFYVIVCGLVFAGTALFLGVFIPFVTGDTLLFAAGLLTAAHPELDIVVLAVGVGIAAFLGDQVGFLLGRRYGRGYLDRRGGVRMQRMIRASEALYDKYGWWSIVVARFIPWGRVIIPVVAGVSRMNYMRFVTSNLTGALLWGVGLTLTGYFAASIPGVKSVAYVIAGVVITMSVIAGIRTWLADRAVRRAGASEAPETP